jgi:hypothetical protein
MQTEINPQRSQFDLIPEVPAGLKPQEEVKIRTKRAEVLGRATKIDAFMATIGPAIAPALVLAISALAGTDPEHAVTLWRANPALTPLTTGLMLGGGISYVTREIQSAHNNLRLKKLLKQNQ